jgi:transcriptional regulator with XRE-family HTH domain
MTTQPSRSLEGSLSYKVAEELRVVLARQRRTQRSLADDLGVSVPWVNYRLTGTQEIGLNDLERMAKALKVPLAELITPEILADESTAGVA